jgi:type VI secretion system protein
MTREIITIPLPSEDRSDGPSMQRATALQATASRLTRVPLDRKNAMKDTESMAPIARARSALSLRPLLRALFVGVILGALTCSVPGCAWLGMKGARLDWREVSLIATQDANNNSPVAVDVVMISDPAFFDKLLALRATQWFQDRDDLVATYPQAVRYRSWEVVPGESLSIDKRTFDGPRVTGVLVFARYTSPGAHRQRIDIYKGRLVLTLKTNDYTLETLP